MATTIQPRSRWRRWQFSIRDVLCLLLLAAVLGAWWRDRQNLKRHLNEILNQAYGPASWGTEQVLGPPDTSGSGDIPTAWASQTQDGRREWLVLEFPTAVTPQSVDIHETYNPGAVDKVSAFDPAGREVVVWSGSDPTPPSAPRGISKIPLNVRFKTRKIKIQLDSPKFPGWNEIDAVGLRSTDGKLQWASAAQASSSYGSMLRGQATAWGMPRSSYLGPVPGTNPPAIGARSAYPPTGYPPAIYDAPQPPSAPGTQGPAGLPIP